MNETLDSRRRPITRRLCYVPAVVISRDETAGNNMETDVINCAMAINSVLPDEHVLLEQKTAQS